MPYIIPVVCLHKIPVVYVHLTHETSGPEGSKSLANSTTRVNGAANHSWSSFVFLSHGSLFSLSHSPPKKTEPTQTKSRCDFYGKSDHIILRNKTCFLVSLWYLFFASTSYWFLNIFMQTWVPLKVSKNPSFSNVFLPTRQPAAIFLCHNCVRKLKLFNDGILK